jgi:hypothetical protein|tara:strand:- start:1651 stop:1824 length:174 start_codon:yes stop_codon:yes gene_type:complete
MKNPGALAGATGADRGHKLSGSGQGKPYTERPSAARILLRSIVSDDGHFQGLEVARV